jgi:Rrf2 family transcriptional regulator, nitric oxide-sensitive transcriptional repressor
MISQTAEYALRAVFFLANHFESPRTTAEIARHTRVPLGYLAKVMQSLRRAGLVSSQRGLQGGFVLASDPAELSILQVVLAVESSRRIKKCPLGLAGHAKLCPLHARLDQAAALVEDAFRKTTIQELVTSGRKKSASCRFPTDNEVDGKVLIPT